MHFILLKPNKTAGYDNKKVNVIKKTFEELKNTFNANLWKVKVSSIFKNDEKYIELTIDPYHFFRVSQKS